MKKRLLIITIAVITIILSITILPSGIYSDGLTYSIGDIGPGGGIVFYDKGNDDGGWRYLEAATSDTGGTGYWSNITDIAVGPSAQGTAIGTGKTNTEAIIAQTGHTASAAKMCKDYHGGGLTDWFLPSRDEQAEMWSQRSIIGNFRNDYYWSSSERDFQYVTARQFGAGFTSGLFKAYPGVTYWVRAIRAFSVTKQTANLLSPQDWVLKDLNIDELLAHYGPTPEGFVKCLYDTILGRLPDDSGLNYWTEQLNLGVFTGSQIAEHFIFSDELGDSVEAMSNEEFITFLYRSFLSRPPDAAGFESWVAYMDSGASKLATLRAFMDNQEWSDICTMFNVVY